MALPLCRLYLITPPSLPDLDAFARVLEAALGGGEGALAGDDEAEARHAFDALVGRGDQGLIAQRLHFRRHGAEGAHGIDQQLAAAGVNRLGDLAHRVEDARACLAVHHHHVAEGRIGIEGGGDLGPARRQVVALVDEGVGAAKIVEDLGDTLAIGAVGEDEGLRLRGREGGEHGLHREGGQAGGEVGGPDARLVGRLHRTPFRGRTTGEEIPQPLPRRLVGPAPRLAGHRPPVPLTGSAGPGSAEDRRRGNARRPPATPPP